MFLKRYIVLFKNTSTVHMNRKMIAGFRWEAGGGGVVLICIWDQGLKPGDEPHPFSVFLQVMV